MQGLLADRRGNAAAAQASWEKTISLDPKHNLALLGLASLLVHRSDFAGAMGYLERVIQNDPNSWRAHQLLSVVCVRQGNYPEAINHAERSLELGKGQANIARLTRRSLIAQNQADAPKQLCRPFEGWPSSRAIRMANRMVQS
jgi:tetratricopeptide (TPR) repeat protein